jgi:hypothetical protein
MSINDIGFFVLAFACFGFFTPHSAISSKRKIIKIMRQ